MPEGHTVYVLRKRMLRAGQQGGQARWGDIELWAPCTGECYFYREKKAATRWGSPAQYYLEVTRPTDPMCPLKKIHTVIGSDNVYVNIQRSDFPVLMSFDLNNPKNWAAFFDGKARKAATFFPQGIPPTVQELEIKYAPINQNTGVLENRIQKYLVEMFQQERIKTVKKLTKWTITQNHQFRNLLVDCEAHSQRARKGGIGSRFRLQNANRGDAADQGEDQDQHVVNEFPDINKITADLRAACDARELANKRVWSFPLN